MSQVFYLRSLDVPMLFTTATLPPRMKTVFEDVLALTDSSVQYVRGQSLRTNISVNVEKCGNGRAITRTLKLAEERRKELGSGQKIVIYSRFKNEAEMLAGPKMLNCSFYHGEADEGARQLALEEWQRPEQTFLIATIAFGCGVDHPSIIETIHVRLPYSLINYVQESGRAGRHFKRGRSTIIVEERDVRTTDNGRILGKMQFSEFDIGYLEWVISTKGCRLVPISRFLNGSDGENCEELSANRCDNCKKDEVVETKNKAAAVAVKKKVQSERVGVDRIKAVLEWLSSSCTACRIAESAEADNHLLSRCDQKSGFDFMSIVDFSRTIKWPSNWGYCWTCGLPGEICSEAGKTRNERKTCAYKWVVATIALHGKSEDSKFGLRVKEFIGVSDWENFNYSEWLGQKKDVRIYGLRATQAFSLLDLFSKEFC
ncbi:hypothetical protein TWF481_002646 [Arthrobotrys musiformis]|uniref:DNA 3'-5' helicase n=1 Tax=Arthrobotrys musiformis TaxID=47236 RepID=A0AAV9VRW3_9PEZI